MPQYLLLIYQHDSGMPDAEAMARITADVYRLNEELSSRYRPCERRLGVRSDPVCEQITDFGHDEGRDHERRFGACQKFDTPTMIPIRGRRSRIERACVDDQHLRAPP